MSKSTSSQSGGIGFCGLLAIVFITLKLTGNIAWSWWWVLSPLWIPPVFLLTCFVVAFCFAVLNGARKQNGWQPRRGRMGRHW